MRGKDTKNLMGQQKNCARAKGMKGFRDCVRRKPEMGWERLGEAPNGAYRKNGGMRQKLNRASGEGTSRAQFRRERGLASAFVSCGVLEVGALQAPGEDVRTACSRVPWWGRAAQLRMGPQGGPGRECLEHSRIFRCENSWSTSSGKRTCTRFGKSFCVW